MADIHPMPSPDMVMAERPSSTGPVPDLSGECASATADAQAAPGMPSHVSDPGDMHG